MFRINISYSQKKKNTMKYVKYANLIKYRKLLILNCNSLYVKTLRTLSESLTNSGS